jgi:hypothetical protein
VKPAELVELQRRLDTQHLEMMQVLDRIADEAAKHDRDLSGLLVEALRALTQGNEDATEPTV